MLQSAPNFFFTERQIIIPQTKSFLTTLRLLAILRIKKPFFSKKCIFWPENDVFSKKLFYSKMIRDQNYIMCTYQKIHFQNKIMTLQFSPDSTYLWGYENKYTHLQRCILCLDVFHCIFFFCVSISFFISHMFSEGITCRLFQLLSLLTSNSSQ